MINLRQNKKENPAHVTVYFGNELIKLVQCNFDIMDFL